MRFFNLVFFLILFTCSYAQKGTVLFFVAQDSAYYSEYIVCHEALVAAGYSVDVRSASSNDATTYMIPSGTTISATANSLSGSSSTEFEQDFYNQFGSAWNTSLDAIPASIPVQGSIQSVVSMDNYVGLVLAGGTGVQHYRVDGNYSPNGVASAIEVQTASEKLNALAIQALEQGKPVLGQCHGASLPAYWRVPGTSGVGAETLGFSILKNQNASGFPEPETGVSLGSLSVNYLSDNVVSIASPHSSLNTSRKGDFKIITSRDWYPQSVAHAAKTFLNVVESYPSAHQFVQGTNVLILHGGAINANNCSASNKSNDVPCNYGTGANLPADYTHLESLLSANLNDGFQLNVTSLDLSGTLNFNNESVSEIENYLNDFDAVVFFKHWSTFVTDEIQYALKNYVDNGKGLVSIHHGLYNDVSGSLNKDILVNEVLGVSSEMSTWSAKIGNLNLYSTNYGHFISSYMVEYAQAGSSPTVWTNNINLSSGNLSRGTLPYFSFYEEIYNNTAFTGTPVFGNQENQITALFSNNLNPASQAHTAGFCKLFNPSADESTGRVVCLSPGERPESFSTNSTYGQVIRNSVIWSANKTAMTTSIKGLQTETSELFYPNPVTGELNILESNFDTGVIYDLSGKAVFTLTKSTKNINLAALPNGLYLLELKTQNTKVVRRFVKQ